MRNFEIQIIATIKISNHFFVIVRYEVEIWKRENLNFDFDLKVSRM